MIVLSLPAYSSGCQSPLVTRSTASLPVALQAPTTARPWLYWQHITPIRSHCPAGVWHSECIMAVATASAVQEVEGSIRLAQAQELLEQDCFALLQDTLPGWSSLQCADVQFSKITGGISNILLKATPPSSIDPVCVKVFGEKTELLIDRELERTVVKDLSAQGFGPKVLVLFANGRVEEFLYCKTLTPQEMCSPRFVPRIARLLARFHAVSVSLPRTPTLWTTIRHWLSMARTLSFESAPAKQAAYDALDFADMERQVEETEAACSAANSPVVFGHCDLLSGNILVLQPHGFEAASASTDGADDDGPLQLIDFEYGAYTHRGFDFGNHFNEYAGFECDYTRYPNQEQQELFFRHYAAEQSATATTSTSCADDQQAAPELSSSELAARCAEANVFALASHIYWGVWAIVQARYSPIEFDYMDYSRLRWQEYRKRKSEFLAQARHVFAIGGQQERAAAGTHQ